MKLSAIVTLACLAFDATSARTMTTTAGGNLRALRSGSKGEKMSKKTSKESKKSSKSSKKSSSDSSMKYTAMPSKAPVMASPDDITTDNAVSNDEAMPSPVGSSPGSYDDNMSHDDQMSEPDAAPVTMPMEDRVGTESPSLSATISIGTGAPTAAPVATSPSVGPTLTPTETLTLTDVETAEPSLASFTPSPTKATIAPIVPPTFSPTAAPVDRAATAGPSSDAIVVSLSPTPGPTKAPTTSPTLSPVTSTLTTSPSKSPSTSVPTAAPTSVPTKVPTTSFPSAAPTKTPITSIPTAAPTKTPTTSTPTPAPTKTPTTLTPTASLTSAPIAKAPTAAPTKAPSTLTPTSGPTATSRGGDDGDDFIPLISILQGRVEPFSYYGGAEFEDANSYQMSALKRVEEQDGVEWMSDSKLLQHYALYCIYFAADGAGWKKSHGWTESDLEPCYGWYGVSCDDDENIVEINLNNNGLNGIFAPEVTLLASDGEMHVGAGNLKSLDLFQNEYLTDGNDNSWITQLGSSLQYLFLGKTSFGGSIPKLPTGLVEFDAAHTLIDGGLIASNFEGLNDLTWLLLDGCAFQSSVPTEFSLLPSLAYFYISDSQITGDLSYMENMPVLFEHFASDNPELGGELPAFIGEMESLASLKLGGCNITGTIPTSFGDLFNLQQLWLNDNKLTGEVPPELGRLMALETLEVQGNALDGEFPDAICSLQDTGYLEKLGADCSELKCECCTCCSTELCRIS